MSESFDLSLYRLPEDTILLLDNINTAERLKQDAHRLTPDSFTIYPKDETTGVIHATLIRCRVVDGVSVIQWRDPFHLEDDWQVIDLEDVKHVQGHWFK